MSDFTLSEIPLNPAMAQTFTISLAGVLYRMTLRYRENGGAGWVMTIAQPDGTILLDGKPLTTGRDLLEQFRYLGIAGGLVVQTDGDIYAVPTFDDLGLQSHLYFVQPIEAAET